MRDVLDQRWKEIGDKLSQLAAEFPESKYEFRPTPEMRSFAEQLRHVAFWNDYVEKVLDGESPDGSANELPAAKYRDKKAIDAAVRSSFAGVTKRIEAMGKNASKSPTKEEADSLTSFIEHNGEHYGQLVTYYRLNGLVPPASR